MNISETLKSKAGPLPVWAWGLIIGVVIVAGMYWRSSRSAALSAGSPTTEPTMAVPDLSGSSDGLGASSSGGGGSGGSTTTPDSSPQFTSNAAWMTYAVAKLISEGNNPLSTQIALANYLAGKTLTAAEQGLVNQAIARFGLPPNGVDMTPTLAPVVTPLPSIVTKPVPVNDAPPPGYTGKKDQFNQYTPIMYGQTGYSDKVTADYGKNYEAEWEKKNALH